MMDKPGTRRERTIRLIFMALLIAQYGCATQAKVTQNVYEDRSVWVRLEEDPSISKIPPQNTDNNESELGLTSGMLASWMRGFRVETDRGPIGMLMGRPGEFNAFVEPEIANLTPQLAKGLKMAGPHERVAYCMAVDYSSKERFITTGWLYVKKPYLYFKLNEYRTPVSVASPAVQTADACRTKPLPGVKTADRFFRLDYHPNDAVVKYGLTAGLMAGADRNPRGEIVFKLSRLFQAMPSIEGAPQKQQSSSSLQKDPAQSSGHASPKGAAPAAATATPTSPGTGVPQKSNKTSGR